MLSDREPVHLQSREISLATCYFNLQWSLFNPDTIGPEESVLIREVSLFQGLKGTQSWYILREEESFLFREVSIFQGCPYRGVPL